jgi:hypothetical protein
MLNDERGVRLWRATDGMGSLSAYLRRTSHEGGEKADIPPHHPGGRHWRNPCEGLDGQGNAPGASFPPTTTCPPKR